MYPAGWTSLFNSAIALIATATTAIAAAWENDTSSSSLEYEWIHHVAFLHSYRCPGSVYGESVV